MRTVILGIIAVVCCAPPKSSAADIDVLQRGVTIGEARTILKRHNCKTEDGELAILLQKDERLEVASIDPEILLLVTFSNSAEKVLSLGAYFIPTDRAPKLYR